MTATLLFGLFKEGAFGDYAEALRRGGFFVELCPGRFVGSAIRGGGFDAAVLVADRMTSMGPLLRVPPPSDRPLICLSSAAEAEAEEEALLEAGVSLCLPADTDPAILSGWLRHLLALAGHGHPAGFDFDPLKRRARYEGVDLPLQPIEFDILFHLARQAGHPCDVRDLQRRFWPDQDPSSGRLAVVMHGLRATLAVAGVVDVLMTVPMGYLFAADSAVPSRRRRRLPTATGFACRIR